MPPSPFRRTLLTIPRPFTSRSQRPFHTLPRRLASKENLMDKDAIDTNSREYSQSGGDSTSATHDTAFDPHTTKPEAEHDGASREAGGGQDDKNPLNVSPANPAVSQPRGETEGGAQGSPDETAGRETERARTSGGGSPRKDGS